MSGDKLDALRAAVELSPENNGLRLVLAETLLGEGLGEEALDHLALLLDAGALPDEDLVATGELALKSARLQLAAKCL